MTNLNERIDQRFHQLTVRHGSEQSGPQMQTVYKLPVVNGHQ